MVKTNRKEKKYIFRALFVLYNIEQTLNFTTVIQSNMYSSSHSKLKQTTYHLVTFAL